MIVIAIMWVTTINRVDHSTGTGSQTGAMNVFNPSNLNWPLHLMWVIVFWQKRYDLYKLIISRSLY